MFIRRITKPPTTDNRPPTHRQVLHRLTDHRQPTTDPPTGPPPTTDHQHLNQR